MKPIDVNKVSPSALQTIVNSAMSIVQMRPGDYPYLENLLGTESNKQHKVTFTKTSDHWNDAAHGWEFTINGSDGSKITIIAHIDPLSGMCNFADQPTIVGRHIAKNGQNVLWDMLLKATQEYFADKS